MIKEKIIESRYLDFTRVCYDYWAPDEDFIISIILSQLEPEAFLRGGYVNTIRLVL